VVAADWLQEQYGLDLGNGPRFEMYVYVDDVDHLVAELRAEAVRVLKDPADMPWASASQRSPTQTGIPSPCPTSPANSPLMPLRA
jgi:hypothetical protein